MTPLTSIRTCAITALSFLVVEEHDFQREAIVETVRRLNPKDVFTAGDGQSALKILAGSHVDVVVSDIVMAAMDGIDFIRLLGERAGRSSVIIASALPQALVPRAEELVKSTGVNLLGMVRKPITQELLERLLARDAGAVRKTDRAATPSRQFPLTEVLEGLQQNQFEAFFQPRVDFATRRVVGAEALARWCHPQQGIISPGAFLGALEEGGRIEELMWAMLRKGVAFCATLEAAGVTSSIALKLSVKPLGDAGFVQRVTDFVTEQKIAPSRICFEISEAALMAHPGDAALDSLKRLRQAGFLLSLDDFGTAGSSAKELARLPVTEVKIDRSFVTGADTKDEALQVLKASLRTAKELKIKALAEGVETQQDWDFLQDLGCDIAQGYFIAKPMTADVYVQWVHDLATDPTSIFVA